MKKLKKIFLWSLVFLLLLTGFDQLLLRAPMDAPGLREIQTFYQDFRGRLFSLVTGSSAPTIDKIIEQADLPVTAPAKAPAAAVVAPTAKSEGASPRYLYVDKDGALQFAESLDEVPTKFRASAQQLKN
jgi:hypothetical protein